MPNVITGYVSTQYAAEYMGYNYDYFRKMALKYKIPRYGNGKSRFLISDLDKWMQNRETFLEKKDCIAKRRKVKLLEI